MENYISHTLLGQNFMLTPGRALFWTEEKLLVIADPHFGKEQVLRERGIPIPDGTTSDDLKRLSRLIGYFHPNRLLVLGDLTHDRIDHPDEFGRLIDDWRHQHSDVEFLLVTGNHDLRSGNPPAEFKFEYVSGEILIPPFIFNHEPKPESSDYGFAGHLHPAVTVIGKGPLKETLPCFSFGPRMALMPSFGSFTGFQVIRPTADDRVYVIAGDEIIEMTNALIRTVV